MKIQTKLGDIWGQGFPPLPEIEHYFTEYSEEKWATGGQSSGSFKIYGAEGTADAEPFKDRVDIRLSIYDDATFGMYLYYSKHGGGYRERFYVIGDPNRLADKTENRDGTPLSIGLFVPPAIAWLAAKGFIATKGERSPLVNWVAEDDLPPEAFPEY